MTVRELLPILDAIAPLAEAELWDNVGLLVGDPNQTVTRAMLCIDYTAAVAEECVGNSVDLVIAYHPVLFEPVKKLTADGPSGLVFDAARRGVAIYSPHTALDVAVGGTNDMLAEAVGIVSPKPLKPSAGKAVDHKLTTFVPSSAADAVAAAMFAAGAGRIGNYSSCSFRSAGTGTFFGEAGSQPVAGSAGKLETVDEVRLETVVPIDKADAVVAALRGAHPYEEPAFDLVARVSPPTGRGFGRVGDLGEPTAVQDVIDRVKQKLGVSSLLVAGPTDRPVRRAAVCAGACGPLLDDAIRAKADLYLTGEMRHHDAIKAERAGLTVICTLHSNSERAVLSRYRENLLRRSPRPFEILISRQDRDPFSIR